MRGIAFYCLGIYGEAADDFTEFDHQNKLPPSARTCFGAALVSLRRLGTALAVLTEAVRSGGGPGASLHLAEAFRLLGRGGEARASYTIASQEAYQLVGNKPEYPGMVAYCLARLGHWDNAEAAARFALSKSPQNTIAMGALVLLALARGSRDETYTAFTQLLRASPSGALGAFLLVPSVPS